jgi:hypothetical protein
VLVDFAHVPVQRLEEQVKELANLAWWAPPVLAGKRKDRQYLDIAAYGCLDRALERVTAGLVSI